jgi:hypothetical protein
MTEFQDNVRDQTVRLKAAQSRRSQFSHSAPGLAPSAMLHSPLFTAAPPRKPAAAAATAAAAAAAASHAVSGSQLPGGAAPPPVAAVAAPSPLSAAAAAAPPPTAHSPAAHSAAVGVPGGADRGAALRRRAPAGASDAGDAAVSHARSGIAPPPPQQQQQQHDFAYVHYSASRRSVAQAAESSIAELTTVFGKMASLVAEQGDVVSRIDDDIEAASLNVELGQRELVQFQRIVASNRALILKIFGVLIGIILLFIWMYRRVPPSSPSNPE